MTERRVGKRGDQKRAWDRQARHPCANGCGEVVHHTSAICLRCHRAALRDQRQARRESIQRLWQDGLTLSNIASALDSTVGAIGVAMVAMRKDGWDLPYRQRMPR